MEQDVHPVFVRHVTAQPDRNRFMTANPNYSPVLPLIEQSVAQTEPVPLTGLYAATGVHLTEPIVLWACVWPKSAVMRF